MKNAEAEPVPRLLALKKLSEITKKNYLIRINQYLDYAHKTPDQFVAQVSRNPKEFEKQFVAFLDEWGKGARPSTIAFMRDSVKRFTDVNRVQGIDWAYINDFVPERKRYGDDRAPTIEEVRRLLNVADLRKCLILFLCSAGARMGSVTYLRWRDFEEVEQGNASLAKATIYRGEPEQCITFVTPEAYANLLEYWRMRESLGEVGRAAVIRLHDRSQRGRLQGGQGERRLREDDEEPPRPPAQAGRHEERDPRRAGVPELRVQAGPRLPEVLQDQGGDVRGREHHHRDADGPQDWGGAELQEAERRGDAPEVLESHPALTILLQQEKVDVKSELKEQLLLVAGLKKEEIEKVDFAKMGDEDFQKMVREKLLGGMANYGLRQMVVPIEDVRNMIHQGREYVAQLPEFVAHPLELHRA